MKTLYHFHPQLVLRAPAYPFTTQFSPARIEQLLTDAHFMEAIYLASPALYEECRRWQRGELTEPRKIEKLRHTLTRYYTRSTSRSTPFGLFAGCTLAEWGPQSHVELTTAEAGTRHTRLDMQFLCALARQLAAHPEVGPRLRYRPNSSLYHAGEEIRYVEQQVVAGELVHQISAVAASPPLLQVLAAAQAGVRLPELVAVLAPDEAEQAEAAAFLEALIEAQVLESELEPNVTGEEFLRRIQAVLAGLLAETPSAELHAIAAVLDATQQQLEALDQAGTNPAAAYEQITANLATLGVPIEPGKLFQTDAVPGTAGPATLDAGLQPQLLEALEVLTYLAAPAHSPRLDDFTRRFQARYEDREVPLLEALDNESGLSYSEYGQSRYSPLVHDLVVESTAPHEAAPPRTPARRYLYQKLRAAEQARQYTIEITLEELRHQGLHPLPLPLPPSVSVLFRPAGAGQVVLESVGGSSAVNLLGRFAHADARIAELVEQVTRLEQAHNPAVVFAEIAHLPSGRTGNILRRPCFRALEIPYLARSGSAAQAPVQELTVAVQHGELVLRHRRTGQRVVPRLSTAHNYTRQALPVYQFLCDLQTQGLQPHLAFSWTAIATDAKFLPRLTYRAVVLALAAWQLEPADVQPLLQATPAELPACWQAFRALWQLPRFFTLADGDNELLVDADNELLLRVWLEAVRQRTTIRLKEFLFDPATSPVRNAAGEGYAAQCIALLVRQQPCYLPASPVLPPAAAVPREFALGSEWLYYKLYCGQLVADRVLLDAIRPLAAELQARGLVDHWFFIRYADPDNHLRVRWHLPRPEQVGEVIGLMEHYLHPFRATNAVWRVQTDTYRRELERYGSLSMMASEALFHYQSEALLEAIAQAQLQEEPPESWLWGLATTDELLTAFGYSLPRKLALLQKMRDSFAQEFGLDSTLKRQLDAKFRQARPAISQVLDAAGAGLLPLPAALTSIAQQLLALENAGQLEVPLDSLLASYVHMLLNRLVPAEARLHELVLYDFLFRYYQSQQARQRV
ncbi:lantibiotic dehydratase [Hymenobacter metallilatus]|uniref:Lantibiotic dehydratase n=1 Tax=Hymenobacter metallilatus TaxID=2493666 RepID=A0A3R9PGH6_9BACT|nr:lantibiotic dehydratase [Hymenobacter metallilatus]RSK37519.1 hypothetical protein EI290_02400 [Hymenobacter metallilatus]